MDYLEIFGEISQIPRESGNEDGIRQYLLEFAEKNGLKGKKDRVGNIIIYAKASEGYEEKESICLQAHMDMVCVKTSESNHDFSKDPIKLIREGDILRADGTSLGADNGIGMAYALALMTDPSFKHGPLEALFTYSEETGMNGAFTVNPRLIKSKYLINLDSEEEGVIYIGCAGGVDVLAERYFNEERVTSNWEIVQLTISGLLGGHSGGEIHLQRLNAVSVLTRLLHKLVDADLPFRISEFNGGDRHNVIPNFACANILLPSSSKKQSIDLMVSEFERIKAESSIQDPNLTFDHKCSHCNSDLVTPRIALNEKNSVMIINTLLTIPHGVFSYSMVVKNVVETSDNLAILHIKDGEFSALISVRSLIDSAKQYLCNIICTNFTNNGFKVTVSDDYPSWAPNLNSPLSKRASECWEKLTGKKPVITSIHAGLECGILNSRLGLKDSISIGPDVRGVHSVNEQLYVSSSERLYAFLKEFLCLGL